MESKYYSSLVGILSLLIVVNVPDVCQGQGFTFGDRSPSSTSLLGSLEPLNPFTSLDPFGQQEQPSRVPQPQPRPANNGPDTQPSQPRQLSVELLMVVDEMARTGWLPSASDGTTSVEQRLIKAVNTMNKFLQSVIHGVNTLYSSLAEYGLFLDVRITDIKHVNNLWSSSDLQKDTSNGIATNQAIDSFYGWSWKTRRNLPPFDHAILVTGFDLVDPRNSSRPTTGVAYKGVMCKFGSVSVVESTFTYQLVDTIAHELGHSLGCDHDGERNGCKAVDGYVMSARTEVNSTNRWHFSPCSANSILEDVGSLERDGANCLQQTSSTQSQGPHLGTLFDADKQCQLLFGDDAYFCRDFYSAADDYRYLCSSMWCSDNHNSSKCESHIASDGFVCGDGMICVRGECLKIDGAPRAADDCPQGDQPGIVYDNMTCEETVVAKPWSCYDDFFRRKCCQACPTVKTGPPECEYGDKEGWCNDDEMKYPYDCYLNNQTCCSSCGLLWNDGKPGCEYGDHSSECLTDLELPLGCYWNEDMCCDTCPKYKNQTTPDCAYGDRSSWCIETLEVPNGCYLNEELCCETCAEAKRQDDADCPYGDRYPTWCPTIVPQGCYNETIREWCCDSCDKGFNQSKEGCEYGDRYKNCKDLIYPYACYHPSNAESCCDLCSQYDQPERKDCKYGDKQAWCWKLTLTYTENQWCHLDKDNDFCCGSCRFNDTAVPVFGHRLYEEGIDEVTRLGDKFKEEVRASIIAKEEEEKKKQEKEQQEQALEGEKEEQTGTEEIIRDDNIDAVGDANFNISNETQGVVDKVEQINITV